MAIAITTPTGNVGQQVTERLLVKGADLILLVRDASKLGDFVKQQVKVFSGAIAEPAFVIEATKEAEALFRVSPVNFNSQNVLAWYEDIARSAATAMKTNNIARVVNLSNVGAHLNTGLGPISGLHTIEKLLDEAATNIVHLRPDYFMENYFHQLEALQTQSSIFLPLSGEQRFKQIATCDIAQVAADLLLDNSWQGRSVIGLQGAANISFDEAAATLSDLLGKTITHKQISYEQFGDALINQGATPDVAFQYSQMWQGLSHPDFKPAQTSSNKTMLTTFAEFVRNSLVPLLKQNYG